MTIDAPHSGGRWPWRRRLLYGAAGGALVVAAAGAIVLGPAGPSIARALADGQAVWRLGVLHVKGVGGSALGDLRVARVSLSDERGVWATAENLTIAWRPLRLLVGDVALQSAHADKLVILRQPVLASDKGGGAVKIDAHIAAVAIDRLELASGVAGPQAVFKASGGAVSESGDVRALQIDIARLDEPLDAVKIDFVRAETITLDAAVTGKANGAIAHLMGAPTSEFTVVGRASGDPARGVGAVAAALGGSQVGRADLVWAAEGWRLSADARIGGVPVAAPFAARLGPLVSLTASGDRLRPRGAPFRAALASEGLTGEARGLLDDHIETVGAAPFSLHAPGLSKLAPELGLAEGGAQFDGAVEFEGARTRFSGRLALEDWRRNGFAFTMEGPIEIVADAKRVSYDFDLAGTRVSAPLAEVSRLLGAPHVLGKGHYDRPGGAWRFERLALTGRDIDLRGVGVVDAKDVLFKGEWRAPHLSAVWPDLSGAVRGNWKFARAEAGLALEMSGAGAGVAGKSPAAALLGATPKIEAKLSFVGPRADIDMARIEGRALRLGASGPLSGAPTDVRLEASARGPIEIAGARISGAVDAVGRVTGSMERPAIYAEAQLGVLEIAGAAVTQAKLTVDLVPAAGREHNGRVALTGSVADKPLTAQARLALRDNELAFEDLNLQLARLAATGRAAFGSNGPSAQVSLAGAIDGLAADASGAVRGDLTIAAPKAGAVDVALDVGMTNARFGPRLTADSLSLQAAGPLQSMQARFVLKGWAGDDPIALEGDAAGGFGKKGFVAALNAHGSLSGQSVSTRGPIAVRVDGALLETTAALDLGAGKADISWRGDRARLDASGVFQRVPLPLLTAMLDQPLTGVIDGRIHLSGAKSSLDGDLDFTLADASIARRSRHSVNATIKAQLGGGALRGVIDAHSRDGLVARVEGRAPVIAQAAPFRIAPAQGGVGQAHWSLNGPVDGLWALFGPLDQRFIGRVDGAGDAQFGRGGLSGAGALTLAGGEFEDKITGVKLHQIAARLEFDQRGMRLATFTATDGKQGRIGGSGRLDGPESGMLDLSIDNLILVDRGDAKAIGGGSVQVAWKNDGALLSGDMVIAEAEMRALGTDAAAIPVIDVIEINRPGPAPRLAARPSRIPLSFDLRVRAPGRVYTRTRGLDAEWSLDLRLHGKSEAPQVSGTARFVRGDFTLAGRRFAIDTGEIRFSGAPEDAEVALTASADTPDLSVRVAMSGAVLDPQIALTSTPALPEDEILPQLLFGHSSRELSAFEAASLAASLATLTGAAAFDVAGAARAAVSLDRLDVREENNGFLVSGGKYLTRDVYLELARGPLGEARTAVEWQMRPRFYVISSFSGTDDQRIALRWKRDY